MRKSKLFASARGSAIRATQCQQTCKTQRSNDQFQKEARMFIQVERSYTKRFLEGLQSSPLDCSHCSEAHINQLAHFAATLWSRKRERVWVERWIKEAKQSAGRRMQNQAWCRQDKPHLFTSSSSTSRRPADSM